MEKKENSFSADEEEKLAFKQYLLQRRKQRPFIFPCQIGDIFKNLMKYMMKPNIDISAYKQKSINKHIIFLQNRLEEWKKSHPNNLQNRESEISPALKKYYLAKCQKFEGPLEEHQKFEFLVSVSNLLQEVFLSEVFNGYQREEWIRMIFTCSLLIPRKHVDDWITSSIKKRD